jgi:tripeptide aminopeptidase
LRPASDAERARLNDTFAALCRIPSPFGHEQAVSGHIVALLRGMRLEAEADAAGNLLARLPGRGERSILLCAHLDTVDDGGVPIEPVVVDGGWENANEGILGADNKAALAVMLELARRCSVEGSPVGLELLFTTGEENGLEGAKQFDASKLRSDFGYVFDHATPIGEVVTASPTYYRLAADFHGRAAHAGIRPEAGRSAILAAAQAIANMPLGRIDEQTTANVGSIQGGAGSTNIVPERCRILAETRSLDPSRVEDMVSGIVDAVHDGAAHAECDVDVVSERLFTGYKQKPSAPAIVAAEAALRACGYEPTRIVTGGGSDANALEAAGFSCVNLANGTERNHEPTERVAVAALEGMLDVAFALLDEAAEV